MFYVLCLLALVQFGQTATDFKEEEDVIVLTKDNFHQVLDEIDYVLVKFYAPWCGHCKALAPKYAKAAEMTKKEFPHGNVRLAKVDATVESELATMHDVTGYPTLKLHTKKKWFDFNDDRDADAIVKWLKRKTQSAVKIISTVEDLDELRNSADVVVISFIKDGHVSIEVLEEVAGDMDKHVFGLVKAPELFEKHGITKDASIVMFKKFDELRVEYDGDFSTASVTEFVKRESIPLVVEFSQESAGSVFSSPIRMHLVAFVPKSGDYQESKDIMTEVAKKFKGKAHFLIINTDLEDHQRILDFFGMTKNDPPSYRMINLAEDMIKYKPDSSEFSVDVMSSFVDAVLTGKMKPFLISQDIPPPSDEPVRVLVGKNYNEITQDESKAVFAELYAPWCGHCQQLAPIWNKLAENYAEKKDIIIAKMDATANEAEGLKVHSFPTLIYYPKGSTEAINYSGERTLEALIKFIDSEGKTAAADAGAGDEQKDEL